MALAVWPLRAMLARVYADPLKFYGLDWAAMACVFAAYTLLGNKNKWGFVAGMSGNALFAAIAVMIGSAPILAANIAFIAINARGFWKWWRQGNPPA
ncbi:MAG TPA: PnuC protein [Rhodospirillaceae bacterium]|nr:PnuC protein [Rhodospirillaceae bacterium]